MKQGDVVTIYEDPLTCKKPEGEAKLIAFIGESRGLQTWRVSFISDNFACTRRIKVESGDTDDLFKGAA